MREHALRLIEQGFRILPVKPRSKEAVYLDWWNRRTSDRKRVEAIWRAHPDYNVGIACGDGLLVIDVDGPEGKKSIQYLEYLHDKLPKTALQISGSNSGYHLFFSTPLNFIGNRPFPGIDIRSAGHMVVGPGSIHETGGTYDWAIGPELIALAPEWLLRLLTPAEDSSQPMGAISDVSGALLKTGSGRQAAKSKRPRKKPTDASGSQDEVALAYARIRDRFPITGGNRHYQTVKAAASLVCRGTSEAVASSALELWLQYYHGKYKDENVAVPDAHRAVKDAIKALATGKLKPCRDRLQEMLDYSQRWPLPSLCIRDGKHGPTRTEQKFLAALQIIIAFELAEHPCQGRGDLIAMTNAQVQELLLAKFDYPCDPKQLLRFRRSFITRDSRTAKKVEVLVQQTAGIRGVPSTYLLTTNGMALFGLADIGRHGAAVAKSSTYAA